MDPLSVLALGAAVVQFLDVSARVGLAISRFTGTVSDAPKEFSDTARDLKILGLVVQEINASKDRHSLPPESYILAQLSIGQCTEKLRDLLDFFSHLELDDGKASTITLKWRAIRGVRKKGWIKEILSSLERCKSTLILQLQHDIM
jgi:hypothetical protein